MQAVNYDDVPYSLRTDFAESHTRFWQRLQSAGTWLTAKQRIDVATAVREAADCEYCRQRKLALSPHALVGQHSDTTNLSPLMIEAVHAIVTDASRLTRTWYEGLLQKGLMDGEYVEIVGTVVSIVSIDSFARALGVALRPLPTLDDVAALGNTQKTDKKEPNRYRPKTVETSDDAWVPMLNAENAGTPEADLWPSGKTGNVVRAMSLVPDEVRTLIDLSAVHYLEMKSVRQPGVDAGRALKRSQMELVAGRVSALNQCYY